MGAANPGAFNLEYYVSLITSEYQLSPNMQTWLLANLQIGGDIFACIQSIGSVYDIDKAVGTQLDVLGVIVGVARTVTFQPSDSVSPILDDDTYRLVLKAKVFANHWSGLTKDLRVIWNALFPNGILLYTDNQDMTVSFYIAAPFSSIIDDLISHGYILPRAQGVEYSFNFATLPIFGFDQNTAYVAGFDVGHFAS